MGVSHRYGGFFLRQDDEKVSSRFLVIPTREEPGQPRGLQYRHTKAERRWSKDTGREFQMSDRSPVPIAQLWAKWRVTSVAFSWMHANSFPVFAQNHATFGTIAQVTAGSGIPIPRLYE
jgi:hypothetical protein